MIPGRELEQYGGGVNLARGRVFDLGGWYHLLVGHDVRERLLIAARIRESVILGIAGVIGLTLLAGLFMSRRLLRQVDAINRTSQEIIAGDLSRRIPVSGRDDEFDKLAGNLNAMLDQIERLLTGMKEVSDNIAHDLRSPLTRMPCRHGGRPRGDPQDHRRMRRPAEDLQRAALDRPGPGRHLAAALREPRAGPAPE